MPNSPPAWAAIEPAETAPCGVCKEQSDEDGTDGAGSPGRWAEARITVLDYLGETIGRAY